MASSQHGESMSSMQLDPGALKSAETKLTVVELEYLPEKKSIQILHGSRQTHPGVTHGLGEAFFITYFWVGFHYTVVLGELGCFIFPQSPTSLLCFLHSPTQPHHPFLPLFAVSPSCLPCSPLFFQLPGNMWHPAFSHRRRF